MSRLLSLLLGLALLLVGFPVSASPTTPRVMVNGTEVQFDVPPVIENGRTLVPMRAIFEALGAEVYWDQETQTVGAYRGDIGLAIQIGYPYANLNGEAYELDVSAKLIDGRTMVPLRFISEALGAEVAWDQGTFTATITDATVAVTQPEHPTQPVQTSQPDASSIASRLLGSWGTGTVVPYWDEMTGVPSRVDGTGKYYAFYEDGTYQYFISGCSPILCGTTLIAGKYAVEGDTLLLYDALEDWVPFPTDKSHIKEFYDKPFEDRTLTVSFTVTSEAEYLTLTDSNGFDDGFHRVR